MPDSYVNMHHPEGTFAQRAPSTPSAPGIQINVPAIYPNASPPNITPSSSPGYLTPCVRRSPKKGSGGGGGRSGGEEWRWENH